MSNRSSLRAIVFVAIAALAAVPLVANAGTATGTLSVSASVAQTCTIGNATLAFGAYDPLVANLTTNDDQATTIKVTCTKKATGVTLGFGPSTGTGTCTAPQRCMGSSTDTLNYQLYSDSGRTAVWTTAIAETVTGGVTTPTNVNIYGRVPAGQDAAVGATYADSVTATVNF